MNATDVTVLLVLGVFVLTLSVTVVYVATRPPAHQQYVDYEEVRGR